MPKVERVQKVRKTRIQKVYEAYTEGYIEALNKFLKERYTPSGRYIHTLEETMNMDCPLPPEPDELGYKEMFDELGKTEEQRILDRVNGKVDVKDLRY